MWQGEEEEDAFQEDSPLTTQPSLEGAASAPPRGPTWFGVPGLSGGQGPGIWHVGKEEAVWGCSRCSPQKETQQNHQEEGEERVPRRPSQHLPTQHAWREAEAPGSHAATGLR